MSQQSTMKVTEHTIVTERKRHPNDVRYPCRGNHEIMDAGRKLVTSLTSNEKTLMKKCDLILDEEETAELYDSFQEEDVIGLGIFRPTGHPNAGFSSNMYKIETIHKDEDYMECRNMYSKELEEITFQDVSIALALGLAEILYRGDKPFGISNEQEWTIKIHGEEDEDDSSTNTKSTLPSTSVSGSTGTTSPNAGPAKTTSEEVSTETVDESAGMFGALGVSSPSSESEEEEDDTPSAEELHPRFWSKRRKASYLTVEQAKVGDVVWGHVTTNLGAPVFSGPLALSAKDENEYTLVNHLEEEYTFDIVEDWDDFAEHFKAGGFVHLLFDAKDNRPKKSESSKNDDTEKVIKAMGLDKKAKEQEEEEANKEPLVTWPDCYFSFTWDNGSYSVVVCPKEHWDEEQTVDSGKPLGHLTDKVGLKEEKPGVFQYDHVYTETQLRMIFKAFNCEEKSEMSDAV